MMGSQRFLEVFGILLVFAGIPVTVALKGMNKSNQGSPELLIGDVLNLITDPFEEWEPPLEISKNYPYYISGLDEEKRPIFILECGHWDVRKLIEGGGEDVLAFDKYIDQGLHRFVQGSNFPPIKQHLNLDENEVLGEGSVLVIDLEGFSFAQMASPPTLSWMLRMAGKLGKVKDKFAYGFFINVNFVGERVINLARPFLGSLMERVEVYGTNVDKWKPRLLRVLPRDQIPAWYGGSTNFKPLQVYG